MTLAEITVVLGNYPHTVLVKSKDVLGGIRVRFPEIAPVHDAFDDMAKDQRYDVCEMAINAFFQARDANKPLVLLPAVMVGNFSHKSLYVSPVKDVNSPEQLKGRRVGVRSYSQTTGLWVRGWLSDEYGVMPGEVDWVVTERSHIEEFQDPANVTLIDQPLAEALKSGAVDAAIIGGGADQSREALVKDHRDRDLAWYREHGFAPINHMVVTTKDVLEKHPAVVQAVYQALAEGIDQTRQDSSDQDGQRLPSAIRHGLSEVRRAVELAARYAYEQGLITKPVSDVDSLFAFPGQAEVIG